MLPQLICSKFIADILVIANDIVVEIAFWISRRWFLWNGLHRWKECKCRVASESSAEYGKSDAKQQRKSDTDKYINKLLQNRNKRQNRTFDIRCSKTKHSTKLGVKENRVLPSIVVITTIDLFVLFFLFILDLSDRIITSFWPISFVCHFYWSNTGLFRKYPYIRLYCV